ncbi:c-type cytochrome, partial [Novosphingobium sp. H3SJ31-1]
MKVPVIVAACAGAAILAFAARPAAVDAQGASPDLTSQCASCHALTKPANQDLEHLWTRKGPDLWYAGDKFNRDWLVAWLQNPTTIRPGGVLWFKHAKAGDPRDTIDADSDDRAHVLRSDAAQRSDLI